MREISFTCSDIAEGQKALFSMAVEGAKKQGIKASLHISAPSLGTKAVACWGWRRGEQLRAAGHDVLVFENGYLGDRLKQWISIAWNGLNGRGNFCLPDQVDEKRFADNFKLEPWRTDGECIIIMGQVRGDMSLRGHDLGDWYEDQAAKFVAEYGKPVFYRPHPAGGDTKNFNPRIPTFKGDMAAALQQAYLVASYNSNAGVDAILAGVPHVAFDLGSMAWPVSGHEVYERIMPDRERWAAGLAHCQWNSAEIAAGEYWPRMGKMLYA